ncbi:MAG: pilus-like protein [Candidatus Berkelbacteria bacterium Athens1014_28]|uniref:Pilus-like protein n=1 Tax=Candidatus Berkelbacteria bacterium Athens1014_28 TaxID=2017145 RepID=A0A554LN72_9BACT|nr:MAG: pilus-like protein [Candidatus Berkelbacteria bacterium Athens1014_28]
MKSKKGFTLIELLAVRKRACPERSRRGFTLIELLIVIAIIGILAAIVMVALSTARKRAYDVRIKSDLAEVSKALEISKTDGMLLTTGWAELSSKISLIKGVDGPLVPTAPVNPIAGRKYWIKSNGESDVLYAQLSNPDNGWCVKDGNSYSSTVSPAPVSPSSTDPCPY